MAIPEDFCSQFDESPTGQVLREIFEAGRFATQTADSMFGPSPELRPQHEELAKKRVDAAKRRWQFTNISEDQFRAAFNQGRAQYLLRDRPNARQRR